MSANYYIDDNGHYNRCSRREFGGVSGRIQRAEQLHDSWLHFMAALYKHFFSRFYEGKNPAAIKPLPFRDFTALGFPMFAMAAATEPIPEETGLIFFIAALFEILMMLISILYLLHFWIYRLTGKEAKPSVKIVLIELVFLMAVLILIGKSK